MLAMTPLPEITGVRLRVVVRRPHHLPWELKARVLREAFAALRPGGCLVVRDATRSPTRGHRRVEWVKNGRCGPA